MKQPATRSPARNLVTPGPTSATSPAPSESGTRGSAWFRLYVPFTVIRSR